MTVARAGPTSAIRAKKTTKAAAVQIAPNASSDNMTLADGSSCGRVTMAGTR